MKKIFLLMIISLLLLSSCSQGSPQASGASESDMWRVDLISAERFDNLTAVMEAVQYDGDLSRTEQDIEPKDGYVFLLLNLSIEKIGTGKASFSWSDAHIEDKNGNSFYRLENDTFISNLKLPRLKGTDIVLGTETGFVCFEIPKDSGGLRFVSDEGNIIIKINA